MAKNKVLRTRLETPEFEKVMRWCEAYGEDPSTFLRRLIRGLPNNPPQIPQPPIKT
jgi:hypothetical protein